MRAMEYTPHPPEPDLSRPPVKDGRADWDAWREIEAADRQQFWYRESKRLTDAECAAEYWRACVEWYAFEGFTEARQLIWYRFASHPHASEVEA